MLECTHVSLFLRRGCPFNRLYRKDFFGGLVDFPADFDDVLSTAGANSQRNAFSRCAADPFSNSDFLTASRAECSVREFRFSHIDVGRIEGALQSVCAVEQVFRFKKRIVIVLDACEKIKLFADRGGTQSIVKRVHRI